MDVIHPLFRIFLRVERTGNSQWKREFRLREFPVHTCLPHLGGACANMITYTVSRVNLQALGSQREA